VVARAALWKPKTMATTTTEELEKRAVSRPERL
jgi:hypothetical protein